MIINNQEDVANSATIRFFDKYANHVNDLIALVDIHDGFGEMADDENDNDSGEQGCHRLVPPGNYQHQQKNYQNIFFI